MIQPFSFLSKYFWALALGVGVVNVFIMYQRTKKYRQANPELTEGYQSLARGYLILSSIPWAIMGFGITTGKADSAWQYFQPRTGGPYIQAFFFSLVFMMFYFAYWVFLGNGAEFLVSHPGFFNFPTKSVKGVKILAAVFLIPSLIVFSVMYYVGFPVPK